MVKSTSGQKVLCSNPQFCSPLEQKRHTDGSWSCSSDFIEALQTGTGLAQKLVVIWVLEGSSGEQAFWSGLCTRDSCTLGIWIILHERSSSVFAIWLKHIYIFLLLHPGTVRQLVLMNKNSQQNPGMWLLEGTIYSQGSFRLLERRKKEQPQNTWPLKICMNLKFHLYFGHLYCSRQQNMELIIRY